MTLSSFNRTILTPVYGVKGGKQENELAGELMQQSSKRFQWPGCSGNSGEADKKPVMHIYQRCCWGIVSKNSGLGAWS